MQDARLTLHTLKYRAGHGYYESERLEGNDFEVDIVFYLDLFEAGKSDKLDHTINYEKAESMVRDIMNGPPVKLIETLASKIGESLMEAFSETKKLEVRVRKLHPPLETPCEYSEVSMTWQKS